MSAAVPAGRVRRLAGAAALLAAVATGASGVAATAAPVGVAQASSTQKDIRYAAAQVAKYMGAPKFVAPGPAFDIAKVRGKSMAVIPAAANEYDNTIEKKMKSLAAKYGVHYTEYPNQGQPTQWVSAMNQAIATHPSLIVLNTALDPRQVLPEVEQAKAKGIPVIATHFFDQTYSSRLHTKCGAPAKLCADGLTATVNAPFDRATQVEIDWIIAHSNAHAHILLITATDISPTAGMVNAARAEVKKHCPDCVLHIQNVLVSDWTTKIPTLVSTQLARDPKTAFVLPLFDFGAPYVANGIALAGKTGKVQIVSYNGTQSVLQMLEQKSAVAVDVGEPLNWLASAFMDQAFRVLAGVKPLADEMTPIRVFTRANVHVTGTPPTVTGGYGTAYVKGYQRLWKSS